MSMNYKYLVKARISVVSKYVGPRCQHGASRHAVRSHLCCITTNKLNIPMQAPRTALLVALTLACLPGTESCSSGKVGDCAQPGQPPSRDRHDGSNGHQSHSTMRRQLSPLPSSNSTLPSLPQENNANLNAELRTQVAWLSGELIAFQASTILLFMALVCFAVWQHFGGERMRRLVAQALALGRSALTDISRRASLAKSGVTTLLSTWRRADETERSDAVRPAEDDSTQAGKQTGGRLLQHGFEEDDGRWFRAGTSLNRQGPPGACSHSAMDDDV